MAMQLSNSENFRKEITKKFTIIIGAMMTLQHHVLRVALWHTAVRTTWLFNRSIET
jgi:hypothetical protein